MNVKINSEMREMNEGLFFGLNLRQCLCSVCALGIGVGVYFGLKDTLGLETVSWVCILAALPAALAGFFKWQGMTLERFIMAWIRTNFVFPRQLPFRARNELVLEIKAARAKRFTFRKQKQGGKKENVQKRASRHKGA